MTAVTLVYKNLFRNRVRSLLTVAAVALPMALFVMTQALTDILAGVAAQSAQELRIGTHHKVSLINTLPESLRQKIEELDPQGRYLHTYPALDDPNRTVKTVCGLVWFGGEVPGEKYRFPSLAGDADTLPLLYRNEIEMTDEETRNWLKFKNAAIVGPATMAAFGWKTGQEIELRSTVPPYQLLRFKIVSVLRKPLNPSVIYFRRDYLNDKFEEAERAGKGPTNLNRVNIIWCKCKDADKLSEFARLIDQRFSNTLDETQTEDESAFFSNFTRAGGDFPGKIRIIGMAVVLTIVTIVATTMSLTFRERTRELAVFKALGFHNGFILRLLMGEALLLAIVGGVIGVAPLFVLTQAMPIKIPGVPIPLTIPAISAAKAAVVVLLIGVTSGLMPAWSVARVRVTDALRRVA